MAQITAEPTTTDVNNILNANPTIKTEFTSPACPAPPNTPGAHFLARREALAGSRCGVGQLDERFRSSNHIKLPC